MDSISDDNRTSSIVLIISFAVFVLSIFLMEWDALAEAYYGVHEIIGVVYGLSFFVLPIEGIVWFFFWRRNKKRKVQSSLANRILNGVSLLLFVIAIMLPVISITTVRTSGSALQLEKYSYKNQYYVSFDDHSIQVSKDKYDEIEDGVVPGYAYSYEYIQNDLFLGRNNIFWVEIEKVRI